MTETFDYDKNAEDGAVRVKIICLGDSAVGKSKSVSLLIIYRLYFIPFYFSYDNWLCNRSDSLIGKVTSTVFFRARDK